MKVQIQHVTFSKVLKYGEVLTYHTRIITCVETQKCKLVLLLTNDMESAPNEIIAIYRKRWEILPMWSLLSSLQTFPFFCTRILLMMEGRFW